jgi:hypothetical protein
MKSALSVVPSVLFLAAGLAAPLSAQPTPRPTESAKEESFVTEKVFSSRIFEVKHRDPFDLVSVLSPLASGFKGARLQPNRELRTISVRDFPENIGAIEAALKRLDVPEVARTDIELRVWVLEASNDPEDSGPFPDDLKDVIRALKSSLQYKSYSLAGSFVQRVRDGARGVRGEGITELSASQEGKGVKRSMQLQYQISMLSIAAGESGSTTLKLDGFELSLEGSGRAKIRSDVSLRDNEKVVVGTSTVRDKGLAVVLSARVIR